MKTIPKIALAVFLLSSSISNVTGLLSAQATPTNEVKTVKAVGKSTQDKNAVIQDWLIVPVFYATNRAMLGTSETDGYSEKANPKGLVFGVKNYAVPVPFNTPIENATETKMHWQRMHALAKKHGEAVQFDKEKCTIQDKVLARNEIVSAFNTYRQDTGSAENIIYVHGCCAGFDTVMSRAAMVASHMQAPVLVYDWVSPKGFPKYLVNETMVDQTIDDFCKFMAKVETLMEPKDTTFVAHSMGNQLVDEAMVRRAAISAANSHSEIGKAMPKFKEIILSNADVDAISFLKHGNDLTSNAEKTRIYFSTEDKRLRLSTFVHGGFKRLGQPGDLISDLVKINGTEYIDITENNTGHELPYWLVANMHKYNNVGPAQGFSLKEKVPGYLSLVRSSTAMQEVEVSPVKCVCNPKSSMVTK